MRKIFSIPSIKLFREDSEIIDAIDSKTLRIEPTFNNRVAQEMAEGQMMIISSGNIGVLKVNNKFLKIPLENV